MCCLDTFVRLNSCLQTEHLISVLKIMFAPCSHQPWFVVCSQKINYYIPRACHSRVMQHMHSVVVCTGLYGILLQNIGVIKVFVYQTLRWYEQAGDIIDWLLVENLHTVWYFSPSPCLFCLSTSFSIETLCRSTFLQNQGKK